MAVLFQLGLDYMQGHYVHEPEVVLQEVDSVKSNTLAELWRPTAANHSEPGRPCVNCITISPAKFTKKSPISQNIDSGHI